MSNRDVGEFWGQIPAASLSCPGDGLCLLNSSLLALWLGAASACDCLSLPSFPFSFQLCVFRDSLLSFVESAAFLTRTFETEILLHLETNALHFIKCKMCIMCW